MQKGTPLIARGLALMLVACIGPAAAATAVPKQKGEAHSLVQPAHSLYEAEASLHRRGYYDVRVERPGLPYSFNACKRGVRYHIHVNSYGDLVQVDPIGRCSGYGYGYGQGYDDRRPYGYGERYHRRYRYLDGY